MYRIRELERKDIEIINSWRNNRELIANLGAPFRFINQDVDNAWYENYYNDNREVTTVGCEGEDSVEKIVYLSNSKVSNANQSVYAAGLTLNNGNAWAQGHKGIYTDTASVIPRWRCRKSP